jgi:glycosyltransferase involved in cell wall biosynthesis
MPGHSYAPPSMLTGPDRVQVNKTLGIVVESYESGGADTVANQLVKYLSGWDVVIFTNRANDDRYLVKGLDLRRTRLVRYGWKTLAEFGAIPAPLSKQGHPLLAWLVRSFNLLIRYPHIFASALYLNRLFKANGVDFVISNNGGYPGGEMCRAAVLGARLSGINALMIVHSMPTTAPAMLRPLEKIMDRLVGRCAALVAVSEVSSAAFTQRRFLGKPVGVIENAAERPTVQPIGRPHVAVTDILCIGSIVPWKNQIKAVRVYRMLVRRLLAERPDLGVPALTIIGPAGDQDYYAELTQAIAGDKIDQERIALPGYCDPQTYLARPGQVLLITSDVEGLPLVLLEAMSHGVPAVSTDVGGIGGAIVHGVNGELKPVGDVEGLAQSLWRYIVDGDAYAAASHRCIEIFNARYSTDRWIEKYQNLIASLAHSPRHA